MKKCRRPGFFTNRAFADGPTPEASGSTFSTNRSFADPSGTESRTQCDRFCGPSSASPITSSPVTDLGSGVLHSHDRHHGGAAPFFTNCNVAGGAGSRESLKRNSDATARRGTNFPIHRHRPLGSLCSNRPVDHSTIRGQAPDARPRKWPWKATAHSLALRDLWGRLCSPTIR